MKEMIVNVYNSLKELVGAPGFEPGASCAQGRRATRLRYAPTVCISNSTGVVRLSLLPAARASTFCIRDAAWL